MLEGQCFTNKVTDERVLAALKVIPKEIFVPAEFSDSAYIDEDIALGNGRFLLSPLVFASLLQYANIKSNERVLDVASGSGYSSAVISRLAKEVIALESDSEFTAGASVNFNKLSIENVNAVAGDILLGASEYKPYDVIIIEGMVEQIPENLIKQLKPGGRLVTVIATEVGIGNITVITRAEKTYYTAKYQQGIAPLLNEFTNNIRFKF